MLPKFLPVYSRAAAKFGMHEAEHNLCLLQLSSSTTSLASKIHSLRVHCCRHAGIPHYAVHSLHPPKVLQGPTQLQDSPSSSTFVSRPCPFLLLPFAASCLISYHQCQFVSGPHPNCPCLLPVLVLARKWLGYWLQQE